MKVVVVVVAKTEMDGLDRALHISLPYGCALPPLMIERNTVQGQNRLWVRETSVGGGWSGRVVFYVDGGVRRR